MLPRSNVSNAIPSTSDVIALNNSVILELTELKVKVNKTPSPDGIDCPDKE